VVHQETYGHILLPLQKKKSQPPLENYIITVEKLIAQGSTNYLEREGLVTKFFSD